MDIYNQKPNRVLESYLISKENKEKVSVDRRLSLQEGDIVKTELGILYCVISNKTIKKYFKQYSSVLRNYLDEDKALYKWLTVENHLKGGWPVMVNFNVYDSQLNGIHKWEGSSIETIYKSDDNKVPDKCDDLNDDWISNEIKKRKRTSIQ